MRIWRDRFIAALGVALFGVLLAVAGARGQCSESPSGQQNCDKFASDDQNANGDPNRLRILDNDDATGAHTVDPAASGFFYIVDADETSGTDWQIRYDTNTISMAEVCHDSRSTACALPASSTMGGTTISVAGHSHTESDVSDLNHAAESLANTGTSLPGTCTVGDLYLDLTGGGILGDTFNVCVATNTWRSIDNPFVGNKIQGDDLKTGTLAIPSSTTVDFGSSGAELKVPRQSLDPTADGQLIQDSSTEFLEYGDGSGTHTVVDEESTQTLSGAKTVSHLVLGSTAPTTTAGRVSYDPTNEKLMVGDADGQVDFWPWREAFMGGHTVPDTISTTTEYIPGLHLVWGWGAATGLTESYTPWALECDHLTVYNTSALDTNEAVTITLRDDDSDTALACTVAATTTNCTDTEATPVSIAAGSAVEYSAVCAGANCPTASSVWRIALGCVVKP